MPPAYETASVVNANGYSWYWPSTLSTRSPPTVTWLAKVPVLSSTRVRRAWRISTRGEGRSPDGSSVPASEPQASTRCWAPGRDRSITAAGDGGLITTSAPESERVTSIGVAAPKTFSSSAGSASVPDSASDARMAGPSTLMATSTPSTRESRASTRSLPTTTPSKPGRRGLIRAAAVARSTLPSTTSPDASAASPGAMPSAVAASAIAPGTELKSALVARRSPRSPASGHR